MRERPTPILRPPPEHVQQILGTAEASEVVASLVNGFNDPSDLKHRVFDPDKAQDAWAGSRRVFIRHAAA